MISQQLDSRAVPATFSMAASAARIKTTPPQEQSGRWPSTTSASVPWHGAASQKRCPARRLLSQAHRKPRSQADDYPPPPPTDLILTVLCRDASIVGLVEGSHRRQHGWSVGPQCQPRQPA
jgi:hypothetical protein